MNNDNEKLTTGCLSAFILAMAFAIYGFVQFILWIVEALT